MSEKTIIEKVMEQLGLTKDELLQALKDAGFKPKAVKAESPEVIARRAALDTFLAASLVGEYEGTALLTYGDVVAYADHLRGELKELKPRTIAAVKNYEQSDGFRTVLIELTPENAAKAGHTVAVLDIGSAANWRSVMTSNGYTLGQVGMVSKGHRDHATHRNGFIGKGNLNKHGLFARLTAEQVEQVETASQVDAPAAESK